MGFINEKYQKATIRSEKETPSILPLAEAEQRMRGVDVASQRCIHELFEEQAEYHPEAIALVFEEEQITYGEVNQRANRLAQYLRGLHIGMEDMVGVCFERSPDLVISLLSVLKAGAAYVPLDPSYPADRLEYMLHDAHVAVLLTTSVCSRKSGQQATRERRLILLDRSDEQELLAREPATNLTNESVLENLAYVIYTSGSTGRPKGVQITHRGISNLVAWHQQAFTVTPQDRATQLASLSFDAAGWEIWPYLATGSTVCIVKDEVRNSPPELRQVFAEQSISIGFLPTPLAESLWDKEQFIELAPGTLRVLLTGGDLLHCAPSQDLPYVFVNNYGPTENTVVATSGVVGPLPEGRGMPTIGCPIAHVSLAIVDQEMHSVPVGVAGELYIGGQGLARCYLNRPDLTAERFVPDPFNDEPGMRLYRTGDVARYLPDGTIEFLGRIDHQIKIRGFRVELGEIEVALSAHPQVRACVVALHQHAGEETYLVAYVRSQEAQRAPSARELHQFLQQRLPEYMLPAFFVQVEAFPLMPNGKLDRRALPAPGWTREQQESYVAPRTELERVVLFCWQEVLPVKEISIHDDFFTLGGNSLLATRLVARMRSHFQEEISTRSVFAYPTIATYARMLHERSQGDAPLVSAPMLPQPRGESLPLSFGQERLWFLSQLEPQSSVYNECAALRLQGAVHVEALEWSLGQLVQRHEALRTTFLFQHEMPRQVIAPPGQMALRVLDLSALPPHERERHAQALAQQEAARPLNLASGPLLRTWLFRLQPREHLFVLTIHHIITDEWSQEIFYRELSALYQSFLQGQPALLPPLPVQYADYALWQRQSLQGEALARQLTYWKQQLAEFPVLLDLPTSQPRPAARRFQGATLAFAIEPSLTSQLKQLGQQEGTTLFMTLLAAFGLLLARYSGQKDVVIGFPIANRTRVECEHVFGFFVNTLALRMDLSGNPTICTLLQRVREACLQAYAHQDLPFEKLVSALQVPHDPARPPLFHVMFTMQNTSMFPLALAEGLLMQLEPVETHTARFDVTLALQECAEGLQARLEYNTDLFDRATIARMARHFRVLLENIAADPEQRVESIALLRAEEQQHIVQQWNATDRPYPHDRCVHQFLATQSWRTPDAVAVAFPDEQLTYGELNRRASWLAHHLQRLGVGPEVLVGICVERSLEMIVGISGILKAGGAYLPLDVSCPQERLAVMLDDARVPLLLTQQQLRDRFSGITRAQVLCLDSDWGRICDAGDDTLDHAIEAGNLAYVIYTSGSSGTPKGVMVQHDALSDRVLSLTQVYGFGSGTRLLQFVSPGFDAFAEEIFPTLAGGATLVMHSTIGALPPAELLSECEKLGVTALHLPPVCWEQLIDHLTSFQQPVPPWVELFSTGGDSLSVASLLTWMRLTHHPSRFINAYGPTEATITATIYEAPMDPTVLRGLSRVPIGHPLANTRVYILDSQLQPVPVGVAGELYLGGTGLARGYLNNPDLTAERFIPGAFHARSGARLYRTGDLARYLANGDLEFLGRLDNQVKIRGFRIDLGDVEAALRQHPDVQHTLVAAREDHAGEKRLVAYSVPRQGSAPTVSALRHFLQVKLPGYMIPSAFVLLQAFPVTSSGKVDRRALPQPDESATALAEGYIAPRTPMEEVLVEIWMSILKTKRIGVSNNFFELGGHSLVATQVLSRVRDSFQVEIPLQRFFGAPTVAGLADVITQLRLEQEESQTLMRLLASLEQLSEEEAVQRLTTRLPQS